MSIANVSFNINKIREVIGAAVNLANEMYRQKQNGWGAKASEIASQLKTAYTNLQAAAISAEDALAARMDEDFNNAVVELEKAKIGNCDSTNPHKSIPPPMTTTSSRGNSLNNWCPTSPSSSQTLTKVNTRSTLTLSEECQWRIPTTPRASAAPSGRADRIEPKCPQARPRSKKGVGRREQPRIANLV